MDEIRVRVAEGVTVAASAVRYDAECTREVAASIRARSRRARANALDLRDQHAAVRAQYLQVKRRTQRLRGSTARGDSS